MRTSIISVHAGPLSSTRPALISWTPHPKSTQSSLLAKSSECRRCSRRVKSLNRSNSIAVKLWPRLSLKLTIVTASQVRRTPSVSRKNRSSCRRSRHGAPTPPSKRKSSKLTELQPSKLKKITKAAEARSLSVAKVQSLSFHRTACQTLGHSSPWLSPRSNLQ